MTKIRKNLENGQGLIEYLALTALIAIVSISTVKLLGSKVHTHLNRVTNTFDSAMRQGLQGGRRGHAGSDGDTPHEPSHNDGGIFHIPGLPGGSRFPIRFP